MDTEIERGPLPDEDELITIDEAARLADRSPITLAARAVECRADGSPLLQTLLVGAERHTTARWVRDYLAAVAPARPALVLEALIARMADDPTFWSYVLARWMVEEGLDGWAAIRWLGIRQPLDIMLLAGLSCPHPGSDLWEAVVAFEGRYCHADSARLRAVLVRYKRLSAAPHVTSLLEPAICCGDGAFMPRPLVRWQATHNAGDSELGTYLGMPPCRLGLLAYYRRPDPVAAAYRDQVRVLARQCGCDAGRLGALLDDDSEARPATGAYRDFVSVERTGAMDPRAG